MKEYLGDGVYAEIEKYENPEYDDIILTTSNGARETNRIVLDSHVVLNLQSFIRRNIR